MDGGEPLRLLRRRGFAVEARQINLHRRPHPQLRVDFYVAPGLANEAIDLAEAETRPLSGAFGREEGVEGLCDDLRRHACARIGNRDEHILPGLDRVFLGVSVIDKSVQGLDREPAAARHCIARVDGEIEDRVLKLRRIRLDLPQTGGEHGLDFDLLAERAGEQFAHAGDQLVDDQRLGRKRLLARERQKPLRERRRALGAVDGARRRTVQRRSRRARACVVGGQDRP